MVTLVAKSIDSWNSRQCFCLSVYHHNSSCTTHTQHVSKLRILHCIIVLFNDCKECNDSDDDHCTIIINNIEMKSDATGHHNTINQKGSLGNKS